MSNNRIKPNYRRRVLRVPDLDHCKLAVLNSLGSPASAASTSMLLTKSFLSPCLPIHARWR